MRRLSIFLLAALALLAVSCDKEMQQQIDQLQRSLEELESGINDIRLPAAVVPGIETETDYSFSFKESRYGVDAGGRVVVEYSLPEPSTVSVSTNGEWSVQVNATSDTEGEPGIRQLVKVILAGPLGLEIVITKKIGTRAGCIAIRIAHHNRNHGSHAFAALCG